MTQTPVTGGSNTHRPEAMRPSPRLGALKTQHGCEERIRGAMWATEKRREVERSGEKGGKDSSEGWWERKSLKGVFTVRVR